MRTLVECVPNFSEGRSPESVEQIVQAILSVPGIVLLDREMDADHNRSVITIVGPKESVGEAAVRGAAKAAELIDLSRHTGAHPRVGATDVVPFVPIEGVTLADCVEIARWVGQEIWSRLRIPVYFYEAAATRPERVNLENIRRGQFEGLREEVVSNPERAPDVGEPSLHPTAGATVVGARKPLIAYNINLNTADVQVAKKIAKSIRASSGGMPCVKAMGVMLQARNLAQVSINLTDYETTPIHKVFDAVRQEAAGQGAEIVGSEIVGLVPKRALEITAEHYLKLENFSPAQILENRLQEVLGEKRSEEAPLAECAGDLLAAFAAATPTPGGGSAAALAGALAASLGQMVAGLARGKKSCAAHVDELTRTADELSALGTSLRAAIERDAKSYEHVLAAFRLPKTTDAERAERDRAIREATEGATRVPLEVAESCVRVMKLVDRLLAITPANMASDLKTGRHLATAGARGGLENVTINLDSIRDEGFAGEVRGRVAKVEAHLAVAASVTR